MAAVAAVVFDLDGTLFDHAGSARCALDAWLSRLGARPTDRLVGAWFSAEVRHFADWRDGLISFDEQRRRRLRDFLPVVGLPVGTDDELDEVFGGYLRFYEAAWRAYDDADSCLTAMAQVGLVTAVLTNGATEQQRDKVAAIGLAGRVGPVFTSEGLGVAKPHAGAFSVVCENLGLVPAEVLYVGDDHGTDVLGARGAGLCAVHLDRVNAGPLSEHHRVTTLADLAPFLRNRDGLRPWR